MPLAVFDSDLVQTAFLLFQLRGCMTMIYLFGLNWQQPSEGYVKRAARQVHLKEGSYCYTVLFVVRVFKKFSRWSQHISLERRWISSSSCLHQQAKHKRKKHRKTQQGTAKVGFLCWSGLPLATISDFVILFYSTKLAA